MTQAVWLAAVTLASGVSALAAQVAIPGEEAALIALDNAWIDAEVRHDRAALERILDEQFLATFASGRTIHRTAFIDMMMKAEIERFEVVHDVIRIDGDTAVVIDSSADRKSKYTWIAVEASGPVASHSETFTTVAAAK